jgi:hypothetical protein
MIGKIKVVIYKPQIKVIARPILYIRIPRKPIKTAL